MPQYKGTAASTMTPGIKSSVRLNAFEFVVLERLAALVNNFVSRALKEVPAVAMVLSFVLLGSEQTTLFIHNTTTRL